MPTRRSNRRPVLTVIAIAGFAGAAALLGACNIVAPLGYVIGGPPSIPQKYELDRKKVTAVFIDDSRASVLPTRSVRAKIGEAADDVLLREAKIEKVLASQDLIAAADRERYSKQLGIVELGETVGADIVVYVSMVQFTLVRDNTEYRPMATARVRVVDIKEKKQLWPEEFDQPYTLTVESPPLTSQAPTNITERHAAQIAFAERVGAAIGYLFAPRETAPGDGKLDH